MTNAGAISLRARPGAVTLVPEKTAVAVVDMQNHFISPGGTWSNSGIDTSPMLELIPSIRRVIGAARLAGAGIVHVRSGLPPVASQLSMPPYAYQGTGEARWAHYCRSVGAGPEIAAAGNPPGTSPTWNADIADALAPLPEDAVVAKTQLSGFYETELDARLKSLGVESLIFTGCTTSICVESTLRDAFFRGYNCVLLSDCVAEPIGAQFERTNHDATLLQTELVFGWVSDSAAVVEAFAPTKITAASG